MFLVKGPIRGIFLFRLPYILKRLPCKAMSRTPNDYQSERGARTDYWIPGHVGSGCERRRRVLCLFVRRVGRRAASRDPPTKKTLRKP